VHAATALAGATTHLRILSGSGASESVSASGASRRAMDSPRISYTSRPEATPETELNVLANVYRFILDCHGKIEAADEPGSENDTKGGSKNGS